MVVMKANTMFSYFSTTTEFGPQSPMTFVTMFKVHIDAWTRVIEA
jgi:hypothetical protein